MPNEGVQEMAYNTLAQELFYGGAAGGGKASALDTPLLSTDGYTTVGNIKPNDILFDEKGNKCKVIATSDVMYNHKVYEVVFDDGSIIKADADHRWHTFTYADRMAIHKRSTEYREKRKQTRPKRGIGKRPDLVKRNQETALKHVSEVITGSVVTTEQIKDSLLVGKIQRTNHAVQVAQPLTLPKVNLPIEPYILGYWLGDGTSSGGTVTIGDDYIEQARLLFDAYNYPLKTYSYRYSYGITGLRTKLRQLNLLKNKHIPHSYMFASIEQRIELLQGLMDTDGYAAKDGQCEFYSSRKNIIDEVATLLATLGIKHTIRTKKPPKDTEYGLSYRIKFVAPFKAFKFDVKASRQNTELRETQKWHYIVDVREIPSEPVKCLAVNSPSHLFLIGKSCIPTHNTDLVLGLAGTRHRTSIIFRRVFPSTRSMIERSRILYNRSQESHSKDSYNESQHLWRLASGRQVQFGAMQYEKDMERHRGNPRDFYAFDEITEFLRTQYRFVTGWNRTTIEGQRCRIVCTGNPPTNKDGRWVIEYWGAWLDPLHPDPAMPGELRWYIRLNDEDVECTDGVPFEYTDEITGRTEIKYPRSRTFIPATLADNPYQNDGQYLSILQGLDEPFRSQMLYGTFDIIVADDAKQVIPTAWVQAAQQRTREWLRDHTMADLPIQSALGVDVAYGGKDNSVVIARHGWFFCEPKIIAGKDTPTSGPTTALVISVLEPHCERVNVDVIGFGATVYENLLSQGIDTTVAVNVASGSDATDRTGKLEFVNLRAEIYWKLREALDPRSNRNLMLPLHKGVLPDLCAARWEVSRSGIKIEDKKDIKKRLGYSPDIADAIALAFYEGKRLFQQYPSAGGTRPDYAHIGRYSGVPDRQQGQPKWR